VSDNNPYAPPKAPVSDFEGSGRPSLPRHVETSCQLMWVNFVLQLVGMVLILFQAPSAGVIVVTIIMDLIAVGIGYLILRWVVGKLRIGRNWMRWLVTAFNAIGWLSMLLMWDFFKLVFTSVFANPVMAVSTLVQWVVGVVAVVLLHTRQSRAWFTAAKD